MNENLIDRLEQLRSDHIQASNKISQMIRELKHQCDPRPLVETPQQPKLEHVLAQADQHQASHLYRLFPGQRTAVIHALHQGGWRRVKREKGIFWVRATEAG
jgi:hypothetical protein